MLVERTTILQCPPQQCFDEAITPRLLLHVAKPVVHFKPLQPQTLPARWEEKDYLFSVYLFGLLPIGRQTVSISLRDRSDERGSFHMELRDNGHGTMIPTWDHLITIRATPEGCAYTDKVEVKAGILTPLIWLFAWLFYRHRQRRWVRLVGSGFGY